MSLLGVIPPMKFDLVKAAVASLVAAERNNQVTLLQAAGKTETEIDNGYYFNVFKDLYTFPDASQLPMVNIYSARGEFGTGMGRNFTSDKWHTYEVAVDCYSISTAEAGTEEGDKPVRADKLAAERLDYLWAQVWSTLMAEENWHKGLRDIIRVAKFTEWEQKRVKISDEDEAESILAIQSILQLQFKEEVEIITGETLEQIVIDLEIDEQFISPFVTVDIP